MIQNESKGTRAVPSEHDVFVRAVGTLSDEVKSESGAFVWSLRTNVHGFGPESALTRI